jgi:membrane fusion protein, multidrug efflux system
MKPNYGVSVRFLIRPTGYSAAPVSLLVLVGCGELADEAAAPPVTVGVVESRRMDIPVVVTPNGTTRALEEVTIRARVRGFLTERHFEEGSHVKKGQLLLVIDPEPYKIALQSAQARRAEAAAALKKAEESKGREVTAAQIELDRAQLVIAQIQERIKGSGAVLDTYSQQLACSWLL